MRHIVDGGEVGAPKAERPKLVSQNLIELTGSEARSRHSRFSRTDSGRCTRPATRAETECRRSPGASRDRSTLPRREEDMVLPFAQSSHMMKTSLGGRGPPWTMAFNCPQSTTFRGSRCTSAHQPSSCRVRIRQRSLESVVIGRSPIGRASHHARSGARLPDPALGATEHCYRDIPVLWNLVLSSSTIGRVGTDSFRVYWPSTEELEFVLLRQLRHPLVPS